MAAAGRPPAATPTRAVGVAVGFARTLRAAGVGTSTDRVEAFVAALAALDPTRRTDVYWAGRLTLCGHRDDLAVYDRVFSAYFAAGTPLRRVPPPSVVERTSARRAVGTAALEAEGGDATVLRAGASRNERLRAADLGDLDDGARAEAHRLIAALRLPADLRRTRRHLPARRGRIDRAATVRALLRAHGEPERIHRRARRRRHRRVVVLVDISGSMEPYAEALVRFAHAARQRGAPTEVFSLGTRLTRLTDELAHRDPDRAMAEVGSRIVDWSGGTRLGALVKEFLDAWGQRGMARGAVVVVLSDGWERDDPALLGRQMERLGRLAHRVVWSNPRRARPGYAPVAGGMAAALPHVDDFVDGHSIDALERLARVVAGATVRGRDAIRSAGEGMHA